MKKKKLTGEYSLFSIAGSTLGITSKNFKNWEKVFWKNFLISSQIHGIKKLIVIDDIASKQYFCDVIINQNYNLMMVMVSHL